LSPLEVARCLGVSRATVYDAIKRGDFIALRFGSAVVRIRWSEVEAFLARSASPTPPKGSR
jgi:excisionase family DNA binding protein